MINNDSKDALHIRDASLHNVIMYKRRQKILMNEANNSISPTVKDVANTVKDIITRHINVENQNNVVVETSCVEGTNTSDAWSYTISLALYGQPLNEKTLNILVTHDIKTRDISVVIANGEKEGFRILYKSINKYPFSGIEKYLPQILETTVTLLLKESPTK